MRVVKNPLKTAILAAFGAALLGGCSWVDDMLDKDMPAQEGSLTPEPQVTLVQTADSTWIEPVPASPPVVHTIPSNVDAESAAKRLNNLEKEVAAIRNDISAMMPALTRLAESQSQIQAMLAAPAAQPQAGPALAPEEPPAAPPPMAEIPPLPLSVPLPEEELVPPVSSAAAAAPQPLVQPVSAPAGASSAQIRDIRFGEHPGRTRIVFDMSDNVSYRYNLHTDGKTLWLDMPGAAWTGAAESAMAQSPLVSSWQMEEGAGGTRVTIRMKQPARVLTAEALPRAGGQEPRIVIDLAPL